MFGTFFIPKIILLAAVVCLIYLLIIKKLKLVIAVVLIVFLIPILGAIFFKVSGKVTRARIENFAEDIPTYQEAKLTVSDYNEGSLLLLDFTPEGITLSFESSEDLIQDDIRGFYDSWFRENGWRLRFSYPPEQYYYIKDGTQAYLRLISPGKWYIQLGPWR